MEQFKVSKLIGSGTYSNVYEGKIIKTEQPVALKRIKPHSLPSSDSDGESPNSSTPGYHAPLCMRFCRIATGSAE